MSQPERSVKKAPGYVSIIVFKLLKGALFLGLAVVVYCLSDNDLPSDFQKLVHHPFSEKVMEMMRVHPGHQFFTAAAEKIGRLTEANVLWAAAGTFLYSLFSLVEGVGLIYRVSWAGWLAIGESCFFIPIEVLELLSSFSWAVFIIMVINVFIAVYLVRNRNRFFHHHHPHQSGQN